MKGTIHILNSCNHTGKILFEDGLESLITKFPPSFESGDIAEVKFRNTDINEKIINISIPGSEWYYGYIKIPHKDIRPFGSILVTYPKLKGLLFYHKNQLAIKVKPDMYEISVKFKIKKSQDGKEEAVQIKEVEKKDFYKCKSPVFGTLETKQEKIKTGFVQTVIRTKKSENQVVSGVVKFAKFNKNNELFGYIIRDDGGEDVYFNGNAYKKFYNKKPKYNDIVNFRTCENSRGIQLEVFCEPFELQKEEYLPESQQYGFISSVDEKNKIEFMVSQYRKFYKKEPEEGDLVFFHEDGNKFSFKIDETEITEKIFLEGRKEVKIKKDEGIINTFNTERNFGFVNSGKNRFFFHASVYQKLYGRQLPRKGDKVSFITGINEITNKIVIKKFYSNESSSIQCSVETFKNFVKIDNNSFYYVYSANGIQADEVYKFNSKDLSQSIACYKDENIHAKFRLEAIESLINFNYSDKKITQELLLNKKKGILNSLISEELNNGNHNKALEYEQILQKMNYKPVRLKKFNKLKSEFEINFSEMTKITDLKDNESWNISLEKVPAVIPLGIEEEYKLDIDVPQLDIVLINSDTAWAIDLTHPRDVKSITVYDEAIQLNI